MLRRSALKLSLLYLRVCVGAPWSRKDGAPGARADLPEEFRAAKTNFFCEEQKNLTRAVTFGVHITAFS